MTLGVLGDTHGDREAIRRVIRQAGSVDLWLHTGDYSQDAPYVEQLAGKPVYAVCGNCDVYEDRAPQELVTRQEGFTLAMTHGNRYVWGNDFSRLLYWTARIDEQQALLLQTYRYVDVWRSGT